MCDIPEHYGEPLLMRQERDLYQPLGQFLHQGFHELHKPKFGSLYLEVANTHAAAAPDGGTWTRPDLAAVSISRSRFATTADLQLFGFEVKAMSGCRLQSVHEALAHTRFVNFSYLVWNRPACICQDRDFYTMVTENCAAYGVGLITIHDPQNLNTYEIRLRASRKYIDADVIDEFITTRFTRIEQERILGALARYCPGPL